MHGLKVLAYGITGRQADVLTMEAPQMQTMRQSAQYFRMLKRVLENNQDKLLKDLEKIKDPEERKQAASILKVLDKIQDNDELMAVAKKIEEEMSYPGTIKVTVLRETRAVGVAR